jgi:GMP synthase (glutamine-hydrolysing)
VQQTMRDKLGLNVVAVVLPCTASIEEIQAYKPIGIVLSGGPST